MNLDATLTVQSNQTDQFTIIMSVIACKSFSMKEMLKRIIPMSSFVGEFILVPFLPIFDRNNRVLMIAYKKKLAISDALC